MGNNRRRNAEKKRFGKITGYAWAFIVLFVLFFGIGLGTLGSFRSTGKSFSYAKGNNNVAVYNLNYGDGQTQLKAVYINVGNIYAEAGTTASVTVKRGSSQTSLPSVVLNGSAVKIGNFYSGDGKGKEGANFNWIPVAVNLTTASTSARSVSVSADVNFELNEIVCIGNDDKYIPLSVNTELTQGFSSRKGELGNAIDAPESFRNANGAFSNFTAEEGYYMTSIHTVLGAGGASGSVYTVDGDFNALATVLLLPSVAIFGDSPFALRFTPFLATCATLVFVYLLGSLLFKDEKYGFIFALLFAFGGLATTVGRLGAPYALVTCFLVASLYFMYRFFAKGISYGHPVKGGLNILFSGLFSALALSMNILTIFPVAGILVLFGFGMRRQKLAHVNALNKAESAKKEKYAAAEAAAEAALKDEASDGALPEDGPTAVYVSEGKEEKKLKSAYAYKRRISWGFAALSFVLATLMFTLLASVIAYPAYVKAYDNPADPSLSYASLLWKGISAPFSLSNITEYTDCNASNVFAWLLPMKAATVYDGVLETGSGRYLAWNVSMNAAVVVLSLVCFAFSTVSVLSELFTKERGSRIAKRNRRIYLVLLGGFLLSLLASAFVKNISAVHGSLFGVFYIGFIPLAVKIGQPAEIRLTKKGGPKPSAADILFIVCFVVILVFFVLSVPSMYGFAISAEAAKLMFGWTSILTNGYFRPVKN